MDAALKKPCFCGTDKTFEHCCKPFLEGTSLPQTAEELMRSRYTAYVLVNADYIIKTTHPKTRYLHKKSDILAWANDSEWLRLEVIAAQDNQVVFKAYYRDKNQQIVTHLENSLFERVGGTWYYLTAVFD
ncbi:YchJ family protein [Flavobacterium sp. HSC-61S13]|uniref:YchJ family protein n=1 Tax=Flavobacterium sp. HSC-61S13 TaxID=2910963 RepID=UPI0020A057B0|nr:YchJ family metal-binding protein [Flavobacterium sp. HSC-61S13]MCP1995272.1 SEC-C motif-containing protein [Flavobacterium sp. HSC-61S13]